ncbi:hypothetical protein [Micromonospora sp. NBC_01412]|uniref:hypothetical protein n=1 Tax=Micromonospora sp. NBC_01412 TaxID=2903590 RepID=UPI00324BFF54
MPLIIAERRNSGTPDGREFTGVLPGGSPPGEESPVADMNRRPGQGRYAEPGHG